MDMSISVSLYISMYAYICRLIDRYTYISVYIYSYIYIYIYIYINIIFIFIYNSNLNMHCQHISAQPWDISNLVIFWFSQIF